MKFKLTTALVACGLAMSAGGAWADCGIESGSVRILSNDFEALHVIADAAKTCANDSVEVTSNATTEHKNIQVPALTTNPASYTLPIVATNSIVPLLNEDLIRPLDAYVEKWGQQLLPQQLIKVDGKVMAIAFMANAQHLFYRKDILDAHGIAVPGTYDELLEASKMLQDKGVMDYPLAANFKPGWNLAAEFVNTYLGTGGGFFKAGSAELDIDNANGIKTLETLKGMTQYMSPDYVTYDTNGVKPIWEANELAFVTSWGSRASAYIGADSPTPEIAKATALAAMPALMDGGVPSAALWWDGFTIAKNISDEDAEASFRAMMKGISPQVIAENQELAVWLVDGYAPTPAADGVVANLQGKARPYPMVPYMGLLHTALGDNVIEYLQGSESAEQALDDITAAYNTAAKEAGFLN